jgi:putative OPT family oligopeptide transporter
MRIFSEALEYPLRFYKGASLATEVSPELVGVGAIIGLRNAALMVAGGILSSFVLTPAIVLFGSKAAEPLFPSLKPINDMTDGDIWKNYVLYIGAGAVAASGILNLFQNLPTLFRAAKNGFQTVKSARGNKAEATLRTQRDLSPQWVYGGMIAIVLAIWAIPSLHMNAAGAILIVAFGFLFVTVSARITGEIGSSSNPISGMTVATLLLTSLIFLGLGWTSPMERLVALTVAGIVCIAASNGGTTAQDLKTGYLIGATPRNQQIGILVGALTSSERCLDGLFPEGITNRSIFADLDPHRYGSVAGNHG